ncbi:hypothetical protein OL548_23600 [Lysinibacillus sp. MHQ-1]|nr:hypothetical protein OL548_23600 [Lysinibacillus sp. MHQ-1]
MKDLLASVLSEKNKLKGQNHRSSGNFNTLLIPSLETESFTWEVQDADGNALNDITFDVMQDLCADIDPVLF